MKATFEAVPVSQIIIGPRQRSELTNIDELAQSIVRTGRLINPITVKRGDVEHFRFELIAGGRRLAACKKLGWESIPAQVWPEDLSPEDHQVIELMENIARVDLPWPDRLRAEKALVELHRSIDPSTTLHEISQMIGKSDSILSEDLKIERMLKDHPQLRKAKSITDVRKQARKIEEAEISKEIAKRALSKALKSGLDTIRDDLARSYRISDVLDGLRSLPSESFELADIDPPYAVEFKQAQMAHHSANQAGLSQFQEPTPAEMETLLLDVLKETYRCLGPNAFALLWFDINTYPAMSRIAKEAGFNRGPAPAIWIKPKAARLNQPQFRLSRDYEPFFYLSKGDPQLTKVGRSSLFDFRPTPSATNHPASKPVALMEEILSTFGFPGNRVLVPFAGSGNTLLAAANLSMSGVGFDLSVDYRNNFIARVQEWSPAPIDPTEQEGAK